jgi:hypothetical protein
MLASTVSPWLERMFGSIILTHYFYENADRNVDSKKKGLLLQVAIAFAGHEIGVEQHGETAVNIRTTLVTNQ